MTLALLGGQGGRLSNCTQAPQASQGHLVLLMTTVVVVLDGVLGHVMVLHGPTPRNCPSIGLLPLLIHMKCCNRTRILLLACSWFSRHELVLGLNMVLIKVADKWYHCYRGECNTKPIKL